MILRTQTHSDQANRRILFKDTRQVWHMERLDRWRCGPAWYAIACLLALAHCRAGTSIRASGSPQGSHAPNPSVPSQQPPSGSEVLGPGGAVNAALATQGGTITFRNIGAQGWWARRFDAMPGDAACNVEADTLNLGNAGGNVFCCRGRHQTTSTNLSPFDEQMSFILRGPMQIKQMVVYQPANNLSSWARTSWWSMGGQAAQNIKFSGPTAAAFEGKIGDSCQWYAMQTTPFACGPQSDPYCPGTGPDVNYNGWSGSKLVVFLAAFLRHDDPAVADLSCATTTPSPNAPWIGFSAAELMRDGWGKYFPCHCYDNTNSSVGAGCGEINVFETVAESEGPLYGNQQIISTGLRSFQVGSLGGNVCGTALCDAQSFPADADLLDACSKAARTTGATLVAGSANADCPIWRRPSDDRYFYILLDTGTRTIQVGMIHPAGIPAAATLLLPQFPAMLPRSSIDGLLAMQLPASK